MSVFGYHHLCFSETSQLTRHSYLQGTWTSGFVSCREEHREKWPARREFPHLVEYPKSNSIYFILFSLAPTISYQAWMRPPLLHWLLISTLLRTLLKSRQHGSQRPRHGKCGMGAIGTSFQVSRVCGGGLVIQHSCFNAFSRVDVRVDVKIPGGVQAYVIDMRGERCASIRPQILSFLPPPYDDPAMRPLLKYGKKPTCLLCSDQSSTPTILPISLKPTANLTPSRARKGNCGFCRQQSRCS